MKRNKWLAAVLMLSLLATSCQTGGQTGPSFSASGDTSSVGTDISAETPGSSTSGSMSEQNPDVSIVPPDQNAEVVTPDAPVKPVGITFPYAIPGTQLVVRDIRSYDGLFLEDGSDREVAGIAAMILENRGVDVEYANITLTQGDRRLQFKATAIPGGTQAVVQEAGAAEYCEERYTQCSADVAPLETFEKSESMIQVEEGTDGGLVVTNLAGETIPCVRVFYKFVLDPGKIYVGGITYTAKLIELKPGEPQYIMPSHYAAGSSEIMMVRAYETAQ